MNMDMQELLLSASNFPTFLYFLFEILQLFHELQCSNTHATYIFIVSCNINDDFSTNGVVISMVWREYGS